MACFINSLSFNFNTPLIKSKMTKLKTLFAFILFGFFALSCEEINKITTLNLEEYYYPYVKLKQGMVYEYQNDSTLTTDYFWHYQAQQDDKGIWYLTSARYNLDYEIDQKVTERIYKEGAAAELYEFFLKDKATNQVHSTKMNLIEPTTFPFFIPQDSNPNLVFRFTAKYTVPQNPGMNFTTNKDRKFVGFQKEKFQNKDVDCAVFEIKQFTQIQDTLKGGDWTMDNIFIKDIYAQNIGLVKSVMIMDKGTTTSHTLVKRYTFQEFESKYKNNIK